MATNQSCPNIAHTSDTILLLQTHKNSYRILFVGCLIFTGHFQAIYGKKNHKCYRERYGEFSRDQRMKSQKNTILDIDMDKQAEPYKYSHFRRHHRYQKMIETANQMHDNAEHYTEPGPVVDRLYTGLHTANQPISSRLTCRPSLFSD